jgi:hypothetical protein
MWLYRFLYYKIWIYCDWLFTKRKKPRKEVGPIRDNIVSYVARKERSMNSVTIFSHTLQNNLF